MDSSPSGRWPSASPSRTSRTSTAPPRSRAGRPWSTRGPSLRSTNSWPPHARPATRRTTGVMADKCIVCHANAQALLATQPTAFHATIGVCRGCHVEHLGVAHSSHHHGPRCARSSQCAASRDGSSASSLRPARRAPAHTVGRDGPRLRRLSHQPRPPTAPSSGATARRVTRQVPGTSPSSATPRRSPWTAPSATRPHLAILWSTFIWSRWSSQGSSTPTSRSASSATRPMPGMTLRASGGTSTTEPRAGMITV